MMDFIVISIFFMEEKNVMTRVVNPLVFIMLSFPLS